MNEPRLLMPECNLSTVRDGRGAILSFVPGGKPILEWTFLFLREGLVRGNHCHPEFDEYLMVTSGTAMETFRSGDGAERFFFLNKGNCVFVPSGVYHTLTAITDCEAVAFLTKPWSECETPIIQERPSSGGSGGSD